MILLDCNVILDIWDRDPLWYAWSSTQLRNQSILHKLCINAIIYAEVSVSFSMRTVLDEQLEFLSIVVEDLPRQAAFLAAKAYRHYRRQGGMKANVLPDFFIGAHAAVLGCPLLTRDTRRYATHFPTVRLIAP